MSRDENKDVAQILSDGKYDLPVFLRYLKTFALDGSQPDKSILLGILMQSLARFHTSDFTACMCLVSSHVQDASSVEKEMGYMYELENLLSCGEFAQFWVQWAQVKENLPESFNFETCVRTSILETIAFTVERIEVDRLSAYLAVPVDQVQKTVENAKKQGGAFDVVVCDGTHVTFARNVFNHPENSIAADTLKFTDIASIVLQPQPQTDRFERREPQPQSQQQQQSPPPQERREDKN